MEQSALSERSRHAGWSESESNLLWETADEAQQQGLPLKQVFEQIAQQTGRRPNSIRNYYYAQVRQREGGARHTARFVPFTEPEVRELVEQVLRSRARGQSVRACLQELSGGDHSLMLRYQNKYRSVLKARPDLIRETVEKLRAEGVECAAVESRPRQQSSLPEAARQLESAARQVSDPELIRACDTLTHLILSHAEPAQSAQVDRLNVRLDLCRLSMTEQAETICRMKNAAHALEVTVKEFVVKPPQERAEALSSFCDELVSQLGALEASAHSETAKPV